VKNLVDEARKRKDNVVKARMIEAYTYGDMGRTQQAIDILTELINAGIKDKELERQAYVHRYLGYCLLNDKERGCADLKKLKQLGAAAEVENCFICQGTGK
jgi:hypothetical protein